MNAIEQLILDLRAFSLFYFGRATEKLWEAPRTRSQNLAILSTRRRLLGASICAVPLSQPFPIKNYFKNRLFRENTTFPRTSAYCRSEKNKMASEEGNWPTSLLLVPPPFSLVCFVYFPYYERGKLVTS